MSIKALFLDIGGVLLTNGWDSTLRKKAADEFGVNFDLMESRHRQIFDDFERGHVTLDDYIKFISFAKSNSLVEDFKKFIFSSVRPFLDVITLIQDYRKKGNLKIILLSNEGAEIAKDRFKQFPQISEFSDAYVVSGFVGYRKPDPRIYQLALSVAQEKGEEILYIDDRDSNLEPAKHFGIQTLSHRSFEATKEALEKLLL